MTELDFFGHWGYFFLWLGLMYIGQKEQAGWLFRFFGETIWIILGFWMGMTSIWMWGFVFLGLDAHNYFKWKRENVKEEPLTLAELDAIAFCKLQSKDEVKVDGKDKTKLSQSQRARVAKKSSRTSKKSVRPARGRRGVKADGVGRRRPNDESKGSKRSRS